MEVLLLHVKFLDSSTLLHQKRHEPNLDDQVHAELKTTLYYVLFSQLYISFVCQSGIDQSHFLDLND